MASGANRGVRSPDEDSVRDGVGPKGSERNTDKGLTWFEGIFVALVHLVILAMALLCYPGHVCNYLQKRFALCQELPARMDNRKLFNIKRLALEHVCLE